MPAYVPQLQRFIETERQRYAGDQNNRFMASLSQAERYERFLCVILARYEEASREFLGLGKQIEAFAAERTDPHLTPEEMGIVERWTAATTLLHLEIESFYLFAKIMLDHLARFLEHAHGQARGLSFDSHDQLVKNMERYAAAKELALPDGFLDLARDLKKRIADFRDYQIAHAKNPRSMHATLWNPGEGPKMIVTHLYPRPADRQEASEHLHALADALGAYLSAFKALVETNRGRSMFSGAQTRESSGKRRSELF